MELDAFGKLQHGEAVDYEGQTIILAGRPERMYDAVTRKYTGAFYVYRYNDTSGDVQQVYLDAIKASLLSPASPVVIEKKIYLAPYLTRGLATMNGTDPEIFVTDAKGNIIPSWKFLGTKEDAIKQGDIDYRNNIYNARHYAYWDGFQAETSFKNAQFCHERLTSDVFQGLVKIREAAKKFDPTAKLLAQDVVKVNRKDLLEGEDRHVAFGCAPSHNAYGIKQIEITEPREMPLRFSGCHYHFSCGPQLLPKWYPDGTAVMIDKIAGIMLTALGRGLEDPRRREYYGRPGEYRLPHAAHMEYRTTGSFVMRSPSTFILGADICRMGFKMGLLVDGREHHLPDAKDIILNCDADAATKVIADNRGYFETILARMFENTTARSTMKLLLAKTGVAPLLGTIDSEWGLGATLPSNYRWTGFATRI